MTCRTVRQEVASVAGLDGACDQFMT